MPVLCVSLPLVVHTFCFVFDENPRTSRTEYCMIEVVADTTVVVKLEHLRRPEVSASATLQCTKKLGRSRHRGRGGGVHLYRGRKT